MRSSTYPLRLPISLKTAVEKIAAEDGTSINQFVVTAVAEKLSAMKTAEFFEAKRNSSNIKAAKHILNRTGGQPPATEDRLD